MVGLSLYFYTVQDYEESPQGEQLTMNISGKQISESEIEVTVVMFQSGWCKYHTNYEVSDAYIDCGTPMPLSNYHIKCSTYTKFDEIWEGQKRMWGYRGAVNPDVILFDFNTEKVSWTSTFKIPNFIQTGNNSHTITKGSLQFTEKYREWVYTKTDTSSCTGSGLTLSCAWTTTYSGEKPPSKFNAPSFSIYPSEITITKSNIGGEQVIAPKIYDDKVQDLKLTFRTDINGLSDIYRYSFGTYEFYANISNTEKNYHEITLPSENAKYKIKAFNTAHYTEQGEVDYATYKEFEVTIADIPLINIEITRHSIVGNKLEVRFRIENETEKTEKHFYYREIGHGINDPKLSKLGNEYGIELTLKKGNYEYWIFAKEGDQERTTDKVQFTINVTEEGIKIVGDPKEEVTQTSYGLEFELSEKIDNVYYTYKKKDEPVSDLKEGDIPRFGTEYNFLIRSLTPDTLYELDVFAESEKVYSIEFRTLFTQETPPPTTPPEEETGFTISSFFIIVAIIGVIFYYFYTKIKKGGKKR